MKFNNIYVLLYPLKNNSFCCIIYMYLCTETLGGETFDNDLFSCLFIRSFRTEDLPEN